MALSLKRQGAEIITYPSAFAVATGKVHWEPLLKARAIETQAWVLAAAQVGDHNEKRTSFGHSMIVSPWGEIKAKLGGDNGEPEIITADIDLDAVMSLRKEFPMLRRTYVVSRGKNYVWLLKFIPRDVYPEV